MRKTLDWEPFYAIAADWTSRTRTSSIATPRSRRSASRPSASTSSARSTSGTSTRSRAEFFGTADAKDAVRRKVAALFPEHEVEKFTEMFWDRIQTWRKSVVGASLPPPVR